MCPSNMVHMNILLASRNNLVPLPTGYVILFILFHINFEHSTSELQTQINGSYVICEHAPFAVGSQIILVANKWCYLFIQNFSKSNYPRLQDQLEFPGNTEFSDNYMGLLSKSGHITGPFYKKKSYRNKALLFVHKLCHFSHI